MEAKKNLNLNLNLVARVVGGNPSGKYSPFPTFLCCVVGRR
jgi:hypothetical protein